MGSHEEFLYSNKYSAKQLAEAILKKTKNRNPLLRSIDILCKSTILNDVDVKAVRIFGTESKVKRVKIKEGQEGLLVNCSGHSNPKSILPFKMQLSTKNVNIDTILCNVENKGKGLKYEDFFKDASLKINGKTYFAELSSTQSELPLNKAEIMEQGKSSIKKEMENATNKAKQKDIKKTQVKAKGIDR